MLARNALKLCVDVAARLLCPTAAAARVVPARSLGGTVAAPPKPTCAGAVAVAPPSSAIRVRRDLQPSYLFKVPDSMVPASALVRPDFGTRVRCEALTDVRKSCEPLPADSADGDDCPYDDDDDNTMYDGGVVEYYDYRLRDEPKHRPRLGRNTPDRLQPGNHYRVPDVRLGDGRKPDFGRGTRCANIKSCLNKDAGLITVPDPNRYAPRPTPVKGPKKVQSQSPCYESPVQAYCCRDPHK